MNFSLDLSLMGEWAAIGAALTNLVQGGVIFNNDRVKAFTCGERLNAATAVIHLEEADPELRGLYAAINQQLCRQAWADVDFVNREQNLGEAGLRMAKMSSHPHHLVEKFRVRPA
ncbi:MAG TPA: phosphatidylglycerol lysyltransferase domain-containing protein [Desulfobaccales bacterium]